MHMDGEEVSTDTKVNIEDAFLLLTPQQAAFS
jgi:hypothetical protein